MAAIQSAEELQLVETITSLYNSISKLPSLHPCKEVNHLLTKLVNTCIPSSSIDVSTLSEEEQAMRAHLIRLCGESEGYLEAHYSTLIANHTQPLEHLALFPYYSNYLELSHREFTLLSHHLSKPPSQVAFLGSGPLPLSSLVLATRYLTDTEFHNYDLDASANAMAKKLVDSDPSMAERVVFHTTDVMEVTRPLSRYDVVFLAALVGMGREEKRGVIEHLARHMAPGAALVVRSAHGARAFLYPVVDYLEDLKGFEVLSVYHPEDEVVNSVIVARKRGGEGNGGMIMTCKCGETFGNHLGHGSLVEKLAIEGQHS